MLLVAFAPAALADSETHFLGPDGVPNATLIGTPDGGEMPNYDLGRDLEPGILLLRSSNGSAETDPARFQQWQTGMGNRSLAGFPSLVVWAAGAGFGTGATGVFTVYLLDCPEADGNCTELGSSTATFETASDWVELEVGLPEVDHPFSTEQNLAVRLVVSDRSEIDLMFAYGYPKYRSRLVIDDEAPPALAVANVYRELPEAARLVPETNSAMNLQVESAESELASAMPEGGFTSWLATTAISTLALVVLGLGLVATLSPGRKRGRHNVRGRGQHLAHPSRNNHRAKVAATAASGAASGPGP